MHSMLRGALAGTVATILMSVPVLAGQRLGFFRTAPPREISRNIAEAVPVLPATSGSALSLLWTCSHLAYGATGGVIYSMIRGVLPASALGGLLFGSGVWATAYLGYLPLLRLYPSPAHDARSRTVVMLIAHATYGVTLALIEDHVRPVRR